MGKSRKEEKQDPRIAATGTIMGISVGMLAVCIPLCGITRNVFLPILVVAGAAASVASVWYFGRSKMEASHSKEIAELQSTIQDLQDRLENVEVMNRFETALAEKTLAEASGEKAPKSMGPVDEELEDA